MGNEIYWTPLKAAAWIATGGVDPKFSNALSDWRWDWKDSGPGPRDEKIFSHAFDYHANEQNGRPSRELKPIPEIELLKEKLISGELAATGLRNGAGPRIEIPSMEWNDLNFMGEEADTALSPTGLAYKSVLLLCDKILRLWPAAAAASSDEQPREQSPLPRPKGRKKETKVDAIAAWLREHYPKRPAMTIDELIRAVQKDATQFGEIRKRTFEAALAKAYS